MDPLFLGQAFAELKQELMAELKQGIHEVFDELREERRAIAVNFAACYEAFDAVIAELELLAKSEETAADPQEVTTDAEMVPSDFVVHAAPKLDLHSMPINKEFLQSPMIVRDSSIIELVQIALPAVYDGLMVRPNQQSIVDHPNCATFDRRIGNRGLRVDFVPIEMELLVWDPKGGTKNILTVFLEPIFAGIVWGMFAELGIVILLLIFPFHKLNIWPVTGSVKQVNNDNYTYCVYDFDIATGYGVAAFLFLLASHVNIMVASRWFCCGSALKPRGARAYAIVASFARRLRKHGMESREEVNQCMHSVELAIKEALLGRGEPHFTDQEFPPNARSVFFDPDISPSKLQVVSEWMRSIETVKEKHLDSSPCLFSGTTNPSAFCHNRLGDCWFLSVVAVLAEVSRMSKVFVIPDYNVEGIYAIRFCIQGEWVPVVVDDWIPYESPGKAAFPTSKEGNELWVSILEKAYAKLHGSYEAIEGWVVQDALIDLTGGAGQEIDMRSAQSLIDLASARLWSHLLCFKQEGYLHGAGRPSGSDVHVSSCGIVQGHAYSISQVREVDGHKLVQIRNPWAKKVKWNSLWSDSSTEWTDRIQHNLKHVPQAKDGIFWMSWQDFPIHFRSIYVCRVYLVEMRYSVHIQWHGYSPGGCQDYEDCIKIHIFN